MPSTSSLASLLAACLLFALLLSEASSSAVEEAAVEVTTTPIFHQIPRDQASKDFQVLVRVQAPRDQHKGGRVPIDLAVALNVGPARLESVKTAVKFIFWQLHDDDRVAIIGPSSSSSNSQLDTAARFLNVGDARSNAENLVGSLVQARDVEAAAGYTSPLLDEAVKMVMAEDKLDARASFVILVTDTAEDDSRMLSKQQLPRGGNLVVIHTIGLGAAHDPKELHQIAEKSHGTYSFVDDENMDAIGGIAGAVAVCLSGLNSVVSVGARLILHADVASGAQITNIQSGGYNKYDKSSGDEVVSIIDVGALYAGEVKSFIVHLDLPAVPRSTSTWASLDGCCDNQLVLTASFVDDHYYSTSGSGGVASVSVQRPPPQQQAIGVSVVTTHQQQVPSTLVVNHIAQFQVLAMVSTIVEQILVHNSITAQVAHSFQAQWEDFVQAHQFWTGLDLAVLQIEINQIMISLQQAAKPTEAYILSWLSSYKMQRPTAMGSSSVVSATFITLDVQLILQQLVVMITPTKCIGCPQCKTCVNLPAPLLEASEHGDGTYHIRGTANQVQADIWVEAINQAMNQMYQAMVHASDLKQCNPRSRGMADTGSASTHPPIVLAT